MLGVERQRAWQRNRSDIEAAERPPGRPRSESAHRAILVAALELLDEVGFSRLSIEGVARRARVGKATVYRRWSNKAVVVLEAFLMGTLPQTPVSGSGSIEDVRRHMWSVARLLEGPRGPTIAALIGAIVGDPRLVHAFRSRWLGMRRLAARRMIRRGIEEGHLRPDIDPDVVVDSLYGPLFFRLLLGTPATPEVADAVSRVVVEGLRVEPPRE